MARDLDGRVAIVTGGGRGIGQAYCIGLGRAGAKVVVADIVDTAETLAKLQEVGAEGIGVHVDVANLDSVEHMTAQAITAFQKIDILVNNAAMVSGLTMGVFTNIPEEEWDRLMAVNVRSLAVYQGSHPTHDRAALRQDY